MNIYSKIAVTILAPLVWAAPAQAATIAFGDWSKSGSETVIPTFTVSDDPDGMFKVTVGISPLSPNNYGEVTGIYFDLVPNVLNDADITGESVGGGTTHTDFATNASQINGVTNLNLGDFDYILGYKSQGNKGEVPITFFVSDKGGELILADWDRVGVRWQSVGPDGSGSDKEVSTTVSAVPLPAATWLFGSALVGAGILGRRKKKV